MTDSKTLTDSQILMDSQILAARAIAVLVSRRRNADLFGLRGSNDLERRYEALCKVLRGEKLSLVPVPDPERFYNSLVERAEKDREFWQKLDDAIGRDFDSQFGQLVSFVVNNWDTWKKDSRLTTQLPKDGEVVGWIDDETNSWGDLRWSDFQKVRDEMVRVARTVYLFTNIWRLRRLVRIVDENRLQAVRDFPAVDFDAVLDEELEEIGKLRRKPCDSAGPPVTRADEADLATTAGSSQEVVCYPPATRADKAELVGLAFSGGGIRSATFNLGVLQYLGEKGLLKKFDYLSTVSGGGYIGSWLQAWIHHADGSSTLGTPGIDAVQESIAIPDSQDERAAPVRFLRRYSNYLTPRKGIESADTWTMIGIWIRNAFLNALVLTLALAAALAIPYWLAGSAQFMYDPNSDKLLHDKLLYLWWDPIVPAAILIGWSLSRVELETKVGRFRNWLLDERRILWFIVFPIFIAAWLGGPIVPLTINSKLAQQVADKTEREQRALDEEAKGQTLAAELDWARLLADADQLGDKAERDRYKGELFRLVEAEATNAGTSDIDGAAQKWAELGAAAKELGDEGESRKADDARSRLLKSRESRKADDARSRLLKSQGRGPQAKTPAPAETPVWMTYIPDNSSADAPPAKPRIPSRDTVLDSGDMENAYLNNSLVFAGVSFGLLLLVSAFGRVDRAYDAAQERTRWWSAVLWVWLPFSVAFASLAIVAMMFSYLPYAAVLGLAFLGCAIVLRPRDRSVWRSLRVWSSIWLGCLLAATASGLADFFWLKYVMTNLPPDGLADLPVKALALSAPAFFGMVSIAVFIYMGLLGRNFPDDRREWMARLGAWVGIFCLVSAGICGVVAFGPDALKGAVDWLNARIGGSNGGKILSALFAAAGALSTKSASDAQKGTLGGDWKSKLIAALAPPVFVFGLLAVLAMGLNTLLPDDLDDRGIAALAVTIACGGLALFLSGRIDINEFSLHQFYRNRLVRCYLGGARVASRDPNRFTGFDARDDIHLTALAPSAGHTGPYPILNTTLNVARGEELAWQQRKGAAFAFTPRYCGFDTGRGSATHRRPQGQRKLSYGGYRPTEDYAYPDADSANPDRTASGVLLGTAMAISGAAVSSAMGNKTSTSLAFLITVMDVRLGWWLGNPRRVDTWQRSGPSNGIFELLQELTARTSDTDKYVYLTDGGHFENLGIYELVRRRCRFIVACDSEEDHEYTFGGLGNAIRKCRSDFGVDIDIDVRSIKPKPGERYSEAHYAIGTIQYPGSAGNPPQVGTLLYIKSSLRGDETADILQYSLKVPEFPHESTADQWFDESHFESYRTLGYHVATDSFGKFEQFRDAVAQIPADGGQKAAAATGTA